MAQEIAAADKQIAAQTEGKLDIIARQIKRLQAEARRIMERAHHDMLLHKAECAFKRVPGKVYYLYEKQDGRLLFSMLSPDDWQGKPPQEFAGAYRLENDMTWTKIE